MSTAARGILIGSGAVTVVIGAVAFIRYWNLHTPEVVEFIEAGGDTNLVGAAADFSWAVTGLVLVAIGITLVLVGILRGRGIGVPPTPRPRP